LKLQWFKHMIDSPKLPLLRAIISVVRILRTNNSKLCPFFLPYPHEMSLM
jgi:hypothetical protein